MKQTFNTKDVHFTVWTLTISTIVNKLEYKPPVINLPITNLWNNKKQSLFIESILIGFLLHPLYFDGSNNEEWIVVDGIQRLNTLKNFVIENSLILEGLELLPKLNGMKWEDISRSEQRRIEESQIQACIIDKGTSEEIKTNLLKRIKQTL